MLTPARANHERSPTDTGIERAVNIENECRTSPSQAARRGDRRFYVVLTVSAQQEKVLLKKAKRLLQLNKQMQSEFTNENFQQLIHLLALSWTAITHGSRLHGLSRQGVRVNYHSSASRKRERPFSESVSERYQSKSNNVVLMRQQFSKIVCQMCRRY